MMGRLLFAVPVLVASGCGQRSISSDEFHTRLVTFPNGRTIRAEVMVRPEDMMRGMMFRESLAPDRGMLFLHGTPGPYSYYMFQVRIPLDIVFLDQNGVIVQIEHFVPPCTASKPTECPTYGGKHHAQFVLELGAGVAAKNNLKPGDLVRF